MHNLKFYVYFWPQNWCPWEVHLQESVSSDQGTLFLRQSSCLSQQPAWLAPWRHLGYKEEALHKTLLGVQVCRPCHGLGPKYKPLEHQIPFPPVCFCWVSADIAIKFHIPSTKFRIFLQLLSWDWTFWKYLWRNVAKMLWKPTSLMANHSTGASVTYPWRWCLHWKVEKFSCTPWPVSVAP